MLQAEPCEDAVSREDVIKAIDRHTFNTDDGLCLDEDVSIILEELPPVKAIPLERLKDFRNEVMNMNSYAIIHRLNKLISEVEG
jgi:hypothetical protein